jgi:hypothetical protein
MAEESGTERNGSMRKAEAEEDTAIRFRREIG